MEDQGSSKERACKQTKCVKGDLVLFFWLRSWEGWSRWFSMLNYKSVFHHRVRHAEYSCVQWQEGASKSQQERNQIGHTWRRAPTLTPSPLVSGLFKSSRCFCTRTCAYHCGDFYLAGGGTFQGNGWPRITHTCRMAAWVHPSMARADRCGWLPDHRVQESRTHSSYSKACV